MDDESTERYWGRMPMMVWFRIDARRGFSLLELIIVSAVLSILAGIGIISIQNFFNQTKKKVSIGETYQLMTALSWAEQDLQFYPRLHHLTHDANFVFTDQAGTSRGRAAVIPRLDYFGFLDANTTQFAQIRDHWEGPYMGQSASRRRSSQGKGGIVRVRLPDVQQGLTINGVDVSVVPWPADTFGNPYLLYQLKSSLRFGAIFPLFIESANEESDFLTAVVSYGPNGIPGGSELTNANSPTFAALSLIPGSVFLEGDLVGGDPTFADFTIKVAGPTPNDTLFRLLNGSNNHTAVLNSLRGGRLPEDENTPQAAINSGSVGMLDISSDDIVLKFG